MPCSCHTLDDAAPAARLAATLAPLSDPYPVPDYPPREWFLEIPAWLGSDTKLTIDDEGRVAGWFYHDGQCLVHQADACPRPSPTGYRAFHQNDVVLADGETMRVGVIGDVGGHADPYGSIGAAMRHYADPRQQKVLARAYDVELPDGTKGGVILGSMVPRVTYGDVALVRRSALSGDWRPMPGAWWAANGIQAAAVSSCNGFDCIGPTLVNRPGLPLPNRQQIIVFQGSAGRPAAMLGGVGGIELPEEIMAAPTKTTVEVDGVVITREGGSPAAGTPVAQVAPGPNPAVDAAAAVLASADAPLDTDTRIAQLEARIEEQAQVISALQATVQQSVIERLAAIDAEVEPLPAAV